MQSLQKLSFPPYIGQLKKTLSTFPLCRSWIIWQFVGRWTEFPLDAWHLLFGQVCWLHYLDVYAEFYKVTLFVFFCRITNTSVLATCWVFITQKLRCKMYCICLIVISKFFWHGQCICVLDQWLSSKKLLYQSGFHLGRQTRVSQGTLY